jgi:hypothetical protein
MRKVILMGALLAGSMLSAQEDCATIVRAADTETVYQAMLTRLKLDGMDIESASKDAGIKTSLVVKGSYKQTGSFVKITFIPEDGKTTTRVGVYEMRRYKAFKVEPWTNPKLSTERSQAQAYRLTQELGW